jgi:hypothetical protein
VPGEAPVPGQPDSDATPAERRAVTGQLDDIDFILARMDALCARLGELAGTGAANDAAFAGLTEALVDPAAPEWARGRLDYVRESAEAMANNVRRIYQIGQLPQFNVQVEWPQ